MYMAHHYGWRREKKDHRDFHFSPSHRFRASLPSQFSLLHTMPQAVEQGELGSCGRSSVDHLLKFDQAKQGVNVTGSSRLFTYYITRTLMGTINTDSGVD